MFFVVGLCVVEGWHSRKEIGMCVEWVARSYEGLYICSCGRYVWIRSYLRVKDWWRHEGEIWRKFYGSAERLKVRFFLVASLCCCREMCKLLLQDYLLPMSFYGTWQLEEGDSVAITGNGVVGLFCHDEIKCCACGGDIKKLAEWKVLK